MPKKVKKILFHLQDQWHESSTETLWAEIISKDTFQVKNIPFYIKGISYDDIIKANNKDELYEYNSIVKKSGHSTYRIIQLANKEIFTKKLKILEKIGCTYEQGMKALYAIDVPIDTDVNRVYQILEEGEKEMIWDFEEGDYYEQ